MRFLLAGGPSQMAAPPYQVAAGLILFIEAYSMTLLSRRDKTSLSTILLILSVSLATSLTGPVSYTHLTLPTILLV